jgi:hypothetical protein
MPHGGSRPGSGRKSNAELKSIRSAVDEIITPQQWRELVQRLFERSRNGDMRALQILLTYRFGDPYAEPPKEDEEIEPIRFIVFESPHQPSYPFEKIHHSDGNTYYIPVNPKTLERLPEDRRQQPPVPYDADAFPSGPPPDLPDFPEDNDSNEEAPDPQPDPPPGRKRKRRKRGKHRDRQETPARVDPAVA